MKKDWIRSECQHEDCDKVIYARSVEEFCTEHGPPHELTPAEKAEGFYWKLIEDRWEIVRD